ncbi:MAG: hypothetical protein QW757_01105 [Candidatus Woesearchaeota archaeon]
MSEEKNFEKDVLNIKYNITKKGFKVRLNNKNYFVKYPLFIWQNFPKKIKKILVENFVFLTTFTLPMLLNKKKAYFTMNSPLLGSFFIKPILYYIPSSADEYNRDSFSLLKRFINSTYDFKSYNVHFLNYDPKVNYRSVHLFTFGKDSLLSYCLAEELKLNPVLLYIEEPDTAYKIDGKIVRTYENKHKDILIKKFTQEFKKPIYKIKHQLSLTREAKHLEIDEPELPYGSQLTEYALLTIPFNHYFKAKYMIYGNEASCSSTYINKEGIITNPVYDQSGEWVVEISKVLKILTKKMSAISLIEPIHELAITKILHSRYQKQAKYQMSCMAANNNAKNTRWCHNCSKCARMYVFLSALKINPEIVDFKESMFKKEKMPFFSLFGKPDNALPYDLAGVGRDEMMLAFYLAYKNGAKGFIINEFKKRFLKEAEQRKNELYKEFFGIHKTITIPNRMKKKLLQIYKEEIEKIKLF